MSHRPARPAREARPLGAPDVPSCPVSPGRSQRVVRALLVSCAALTVAVAVLGGLVHPDARPTAVDDDRASLSGAAAGPTTPDPAPSSTAAPSTAAPSADPSPPAPTDDGSEESTVQGGVLTSGPVATIGVATYNVFNYRPEADIAADLAKLTGRGDVDVVGWQEADEIPDLFPALDAAGWATRYFPDGGRENAISWRRSEFALVDASSVLVHRGADAPLTPKPYPDRYVTSVVLRHKASGERLTVFDTHLNHYVEDLSDPGTWRNNLTAVRAKDHLAALADLWRRADTRWVVGVGDLNFDYRSESRVRPVRGISRTLGDLAESSYEALGLRGLPPTHRLSGRWIDYVLAGRAAIDADHLEIRSQKALEGYGSDHRPLLVRIEIA